MILGTPDEADFLVRTTGSVLAPVARSVPPKSQNGCQFPAETASDGFQHRTGLYGISTATVIPARADEVNRLGP